MTVRRGTSNGNSAGSSEDRRRRRAWLLNTYRADVDVFSGEHGGESFWDKDGVLAAPLGQGDPACRCYRCGRLLVLEVLTVDRILPGCNSETGGATRGR